MILPFGTKLIAGDSWQWTFDDLPSQWDPALYTLNVYLRGPAKLDLQNTTPVVASQCEVDATPVQTSPLPGGIYAFQVVMLAKDASSRQELARGTVEILENIQAQGDSYDGRSFVKKTLDAIESALADLATHNLSEYQIPGSTGGRMIKYYDRNELLALRDEFAYRYKKELEASGQLQSQSNQVLAGFADPTNPVLLRLWKNFPGSGA